jgi:hypothetical protein
MDNKLMDKKSMEIPWTLKDPVEIRIVFERDCDLGLNKVIDGLYT